MTVHSHRAILAALAVLLVLAILAPYSGPFLQNTAFVKKYREQFGKVPSYYSESNYTTPQWIHETLKKTDSKWPAAEEFRKVFASITLETISAPVRLDEQLNPVQNIYISKIEKKKLFGYPDDELWNTVIKTYENAGLYWTYDKAEFLK